MATGIVYDRGVETGTASVAYVIVAYRSEALLPACLHAIDEDRQGRDRPIVVVDNASPDRSMDVARAHPSRPMVVSAVRNGGYGVGCNLGSRAVATDAVFFVNPDARIPPGVTDALLAELADPVVAAVAPSSVDPSSMHAEAAGHEPTLRSAVGHFLLLNRIPGVSRWFPALQFPVGQMHAPVDADWVGGAALLVRRSAFDEVDGFDESIFLYMEDVDLCRRLREQGWRIRFVPGQTVEHEMGGSQGERQLDRWYAGFDAYLRRTQGRGAAWCAAVAAAIGMAGRSAAYRLLPGRARQARRMLLGARAAARRLL